MDDASLLSEYDLIWSVLRYGCQRLILMGNDKLRPEVFAISDETTINTFWSRASKLMQSIPSVPFLKP